MRSRDLSLNALRVFNAAARHLNLMRAADELAITQGAASRQIQVLESQLGAKLFERGPRGLKFTEAGDMLASHTRKMFDELSAVTEQLSGKRSRQTLRVAVARSFAVRVLARRIAAFQALYPWINVYLDGHRHMADLVKGEADAAIRIGDGNWPDLYVESLGKERLSPVCSPSLVKLLRTDKRTEPKSLKGFTLLHYAEQSHWASWLKAHGGVSVDLEKSVYFSETAMLLAAAEAGQGVAITRMSLVSAELESGVLVKPWSLEIPDAHEYHFCCAPDALRKPAVKAFHDWLCGECST